MCDRQVGQEKVEPLKCVIEQVVQAEQKLKHLPAVSWPGQTVKAKM